MSFIVATSSYPCGSINTFTALEEKLDAWVFEAKSQGASLAVFPEYGTIEAAQIECAEKARSLVGQIEIMGVLLPRLLSLWKTLSARHHISIVAPTILLELEAGRLVNRCYFIDPSGQIDFQDKMVPTTFERDQWGFVPAFSNSPDAAAHDQLPVHCPLKIFDTEFGRFSILICYDCEFPSLARAAVMAGAEILIVPSCTDTIAGYWRVRIGAMARALEGQCYVVQSSLVGDANWSPSTDVNIGAAGVFCPPDEGLPETGIVAVGEVNKPQWIYGEIDLEKIRHVRQRGAVRGVVHWDEQFSFTDTPSLLKFPFKSEGV